MMQGDDRAFVDASGKIELRTELARDFGREGNIADLSAGNAHSMNLAAPGDHQIFAVGGKGVVREKVAGVERFLIIALNRILQPLFFTRREIANTQAGFGFVAGPVNQRIGIRGNFRAERAQGSVGNRVFFAGDPVAPHDLGQRELGIVGQGLLALSVVEVLAVAG
jgi:hypothetical protein